MRPSYNSSVDGDGLQADVMRFMAIIAFCLVAILALVREAQPPAVSAQTPQAPQLPAPESMTAEPTKPAADLPPEVPQQVVAKPQPAQLHQAQRQSVERPAQPRIPAPTTADPVVTPKPKEVIEPIANQPRVAEAQAAVPETPELEAALPTPQLAAAPAQVDAVEPVPESEPENEQGLSLRFASERDFLRLLSSGRVEVFLFQEQQALKLGRDFQFAQAQAPHQLFELLPQTIPQAIIRTARAEVGDLQPYGWGVVFPAALRTQIRQWVARERNGELLIDRFGQVTHVDG